MDLQTLAQQRVALYRKSSSNITSDNSIELPAEIDALIDNKNYRKKYLKLIREGHLADLQELAKIAATRKQPSHWFAKACAKAMWERTLKFLAKCREVAKNAQEVLQRVPIPTEKMRALYAACWRSGGHVIRHAVAAQEVGKDPVTYFFWRTSKKAAQLGV